MRHELKPEPPQDVVKHGTLVGEHEERQVRGEKIPRQFVEQTPAEEGDPGRAQQDVSDDDQKVTRYQSVRRVAYALRVTVMLLVLVIAGLPFILRRPTSVAPKPLSPKYASLRDAISLLVTEARGDWAPRTTHIDVELACVLQSVTQPDGSIKRQWVVLDSRTDVSSEKVQKLKFRISLIDSSSGTDGETPSTSESTRPAGSAPR